MPAEHGAGHKRQGSAGSEATGMSALQQHIDDLTQVRHAQVLPDAQLVIDVMQKPKTTCAQQCQPGLCA